MHRGKAWLGRRAAGPAPSERWERKLAREMRSGRVRKQNRVLRGFMGIGPDRYLNLIYMIFSSFGIEFRYMNAR